MTYSDFITLMMIFFIVLYTFTPGVERSKFNMILQAFKGKESVLEQKSRLSKESLETRQEHAKQWEKLQQYINAEHLEKQIQVDLISDGIRITLGESLTFNSGSARLLDQSKKTLRKITAMIEENNKDDIKGIEIQGHTDNIPIRSNSMLFKNNWQLGAARATSVLKFLVDNTSIPPIMFKASTLGEYHPRADNNTDDGRRRNRRVEVYIRFKQDSKSTGNTDKKNFSHSLSNRTEPLNINYGRTNFPTKSIGTGR